ncbi:EamA family transporter [Polaribacter sargassicola]|uniref:EamA family transporter n=1 Tax=Polaribacter sargassicola TaxID=2836891 RepID=UPI001F16E7A5|nr:EamA family transporter [Polaribacter sp. DS7-9]MCG1037159.1 DMT family transporter [Polaribacter sp. DS7-9]
MIYLVLSVLFATSLFVIFKYFEVFKIDTLKAIIINYLVAFSFGIGLSEVEFSFVEIPQKPWFFGAMILGALFVSIFFVMANTAQKNGVSVASVAGKMSVVIPIVFGVFLYDESVNFFKVLGIIIALLAVYLASVKDQNSNVEKASLLFPILLFFGSGAIDTILKYVEVNFVPENEVSLFSGSLFGFAALFGLIVLLIKTIKKRESFGCKNIIGGIVLGIPNYFTIVFIIKALQTKGFESSTIFTINNVAVVIVSTIVGLILFKEQFSLKNKIGVFLAIVGIILVTIAS